MEYHCFSVDCTDEMYHGSKSLIRERLPSCQPPIISQTYRNAIIVEASSILRKLSNMSADNFYEFAVVFYIYVIRLAEGFDRLDVVFDRYFKNSFKPQTRKGQGSTGTRVLQITDVVPFPRNFLTVIQIINMIWDYTWLQKLCPFCDVGNTHLLLCATHDNWNFLSTNCE